MLQRVQTLYLLLAFIVSVLMLFLPIFNLSISDIDNTVTKTSVIGAYGIVGDVSQSLPLYIVFVITAMLSVLAIFLYKNRKKQLLVCRLNLLFQIFIAISFLLVSFFGFDHITEKYKDLGYIVSELKLGYGAGYYLLFLGIPFLLLAIRGIRHDEALLKSIDRIR